MPNKPLHRREVLLKTSMVLAAGALMKPREGLSQKGHEHHHGATGAGVYDKVLEIARLCIETGQKCQAHCIELYRQKDMDMAECLASITEMMALCEALVKVGTLNSKLTPQMAKICIDVCNSCAKACEVHAKKHAVCKDCMEACKKCAEECKKISA